MSALRKIVTGTPDSSPGKGVATPKNTGKRSYEDEQWHVSGYKPMDTLPYVQPPKKKSRIAVPQQLNFTETESLASLRAQVTGLRQENTKLVLDVCRKNQAIAFHKDQYNDLRLEHNRLQRLSNNLDRQMKEAEDAYKIQVDLYGIAVANSFADEDKIRKLKLQLNALEARNVRKEADVRAFQLDMNDRLNSFLAIEL